MSDTTSATVAPALSVEHIKAAVSVFTLILFLGLVIVAYVNKDQTSFNLLCGAGIAMAQSVVGYWLGSSSGSARKDAVIAASAPPPAPGLAP